jgi:hypothetical protein
VALVVYGLHGFERYLDRDLGLFVYGGEQIAHGVPPYQDVFNSVGPLADAIPGAAIWVGHLVGADPVFSARLLYLGLSALCCALICVLARETFDSRVAGFLAPALFLPFENFTQLAASGPREKTAMVAFLLAALVLVVRRRWLAAGAFAALATLTWQPALLVALASAVVGALLADGRRTRALLRFVAGGLGVTAITVAYFALVGGLRPAINGFIVVNLLYTHQPSAIATPFHIWSVLWAAYHQTLLLALGGLACMLLLAVFAVPRALPRAPSRSTSAQRLVTVGAGAAVGTIWTIWVIDGGPDLFLLLPFSAMGLAGVVLLGLRRVSPKVGVPVLVGLICAAVVEVTVLSVTTRGHGLVIERANVRAVLGTQPPSATVLSLNAPEVLAIAQRTNPTPYQLFDARMLQYLQHQEPGVLTDLQQRLAAAPPTFVVRAFGKTGHWADGVLARDYWRVARTKLWTWYLNKSAGRAALIRAREASHNPLGDG